MTGGKTKINRANSHSSNPIHKAAPTKKGPAVQTAAEPTVAVQTQFEPTRAVQTQSESTPTAGSGSESHDLNKIAVAVGAVAVVGLMFMAFR